MLKVLIIGLVGAAVAVGSVSAQPVLQPASGLDNSGKLIVGSSYQLQPAIGVQP